ncbi:uncharacterized protein LOC117967705 [Acipenser ruthenus]|uniref:uncharacterized protein LOC117967705 n=1 Tax=Acipenser ruthenus TaxID=7906 RepID=UPI001560B29B|nr:uncharacterized protein LOC117967705 [Acipenser ruthenus]
MVAPVLIPAVVAAMGAAAGIKVGHAVHVVIGTMLGATAGLAAAMFLGETVIAQPEKGHKLAMAGATVGTVLGCAVGLEAGVVAAIAVVGALLLYSGMGINEIVYQGIADIKHLIDALLEVIDMAGEKTIQAGISVLLGMMVGVSLEGNAGIWLCAGTAAVLGAVLSGRTEDVFMETTGAAVGAMLGTRAGIGIIALFLIMKKDFTLRLIKQRTENWPTVALVERIRSMGETTVGAAIAAVLGMMVGVAMGAEVGILLRACTAAVLGAVFSRRAGATGAFAAATGATVGAMLGTAVLVVTPLLILKMGSTLGLLIEQVKYIGSDVQELMNAFTSLDLQEGGMRDFFFALITVMGVAWLVAVFLAALLV